MVIATSSYQARTGEIKDLSVFQNARDQSMRHEAGPMLGELQLVDGLKVE